MSSVGSITFRSEQDVDYAVDARGSFEKITRRGRAPQYRRSGTAPASVNGIHKRRQSRWTWGHGRGARLENLRSFAHCLIAVVVAACCSAATAAPIAINFVTIGNAGNAANPSAPANVAGLGGGAVNYVFNIGRSEVTNAQYAEFLNSVARVSDSNALFNPSMQITRTGSAPNFSYAPTGGNGSLPVAFVSFNDTFRFANWLNNGMPDTGFQDANTTENGAYDMALSQPTRQAGATFWIPSVNEWYKAAFYNPTLNSGLGGYTLYPVNSATMTASAPPGTSTSANFNSVVGTTTAVDSYSTATSYYGAYDMAGNAQERLDTPVGSSYYLMQSSYLGGIFSAASNQSMAFASADRTAESAWHGFRVAAVPEPSTIMLAGLGIGMALLGRNRNRFIASRRKS